jgi:hypothetical protein
MSDAPKQPSDSPSACEARSTPCAGYTAQPWIAEPTRAGWWWFVGWFRPQLVDVELDGDRYIAHLTNGNTLHVAKMEGLWAGPVEPPPAPDGVPPYIVPLSARPLVGRCAPVGGSLSVEAGGGTTKP